MVKINKLFEQLKRRDFIQETIDSLLNASTSIDKLYKKLKSGEISVDDFEEEYTHIVGNISEDCNDEKYYPNNSCSYILDDGTEVKSKH